MSEERNDLIIIGGGVCGMTAAIYAARANLKTVLIEKHVCGGLVNSTHVVENFPSYPSINGMDLMEKVQEHVESLNVPVHDVVEIESVDLTGSVKRVTTDEGVFEASSVIIATGRTPKKLPLETECQQIMYCAICDGTGFVNKDVIVVGGGNSGVDESLYLLKLGVKSILLIEEADRLFASESAVEKLKSFPNVTVMTSTKIEEIIHDEKIQSVKLVNTQEGTKFESNAEGIFVYIGQDPQTEVFDGQITLDKNSYIPVDSEMRTNVAGVFAAGDVIQKKYRQITTAMGDATVAALSVIEFLNAIGGDQE